MHVTPPPSPPLGSWLLRVPKLTHNQTTASLGLALSVALGYTKVMVSLKRNCAMLFPIPNFGASISISVEVAAAPPIYFHDHEGPDLAKYKFCRSRISQQSLNFGLFSQPAPSPCHNIAQQGLCAVCVGAGSV